MIGYHLPPACIGYNHPNILETMKCPLSLQIFKEPVILLGDGRTYEKELIEKWLVDHNTSPITRERMVTPKIIENRSFKDLIQEFITTIPMIQYSDAQYLSPLIVVEFHNALLGFIPADKILQSSLKTRQQQLLSSYHLNNKAKLSDILPYVRILLDNEPRLAIISFESTHEKISAFQFACKHATNDDVINFLFERIKTIYKINKSYCIGLFKGVLRGRFVGLVKMALSPTEDNLNIDYELLKAMGISNNFMFLTAASALGSEYIAKSIEYGATPTIKGKNGFSALMEAVVHMNISAVPYLVEHCKLPVKPALPYAFLYRQDEILGYLLGNISVIGVPTIHLLVNKNLLEDWGKDRMVDLIKKIIDMSKSNISIHRSDHIDVLDDQNQSALYIAVAQRLHEFVKILLQLGANPAITSPYTPLHMACQSGDESIMSELIASLKNPNDINIPDVDGNTPFDIAMENNHPAIIKLLMNSTASILNVNYMKLKDMGLVEVDTQQLLLRKRLKSFANIGSKKGNSSLVKEN